MKLRLVTAAASIGVIATMLPTHAATTTASVAPKPQITDPSGDANGLNDQGTGLGAPPSTQSPAGDSAADLTGLTFQTTFKTVTTTRTVVVKTKKKGKVVTIKKKIATTTKVPTGSTITVTTAAAPDTTTEYITQVASSGACKSIWFIYNGSVSPVYAQNRGVCEDGSGNVTIAGPTAAVVGSTVVWTLPLSTFPVGTTFSTISTNTTPGLTPGLTIDQTETSPFTFTVGK